MSEPIVVMQLRVESHVDKGVNNPYTQLVVDSLPSYVTTRYFRWKGILTDRFDVLHAHWPEQIVRHANPAIGSAKALLFLLFLLRIKLQRTAVVRTVHNLRPHETGSRTERFVLRQLDRWTDLWIVLNEATPVPEGKPRAIIPHGHYRDWYSEPSPESVVRGRLLAFGMIRAYKGVDALVRAFRDCPHSDLSLHVCGRPDSEETVETLERLSAGDSRISLSLRFVPDEELAREIAAAEVVVLPYREIHNSGVALLALSMNRPIIVRQSETTKLLAEEFGPEWVYLYDEDLSAQTLERALAAVGRSARPRRVDMATRDWKKLGDALAESYRVAIGIARGEPNVGNARRDWEK